MPASPPPPPAPEPALQTAARLLAEGRPDRATDLLGALLDGAPTYAAAHVLHATALEASGRSADALEAWTRAAFLVPRSPLVLRERQRLASLFAPAPPPEPEDRLVGERPAADLAPEPAIVHEPTAEEPTAEIAGAAEADDATEGIALPQQMSVDEFISFDDDAPPFEGLPLDDLPAFAETGTPFFGEDDDDAAPLTDDLAETAPDETTPDEPSVADWGDLPPIRVPLLPPDAPVDDAPVDAAPMAPPPAPPAAEPDDWRVIETVDDGEPTPPAAPRPAPTPAPEPRPEPTIVLEPKPAGPAGAVPDDLDALITSLEHAPRIRPDPAFSGPSLSVDESGVDELVSETLAKIYAAQHRYVEAAVMYEKLAAREPDRAEAMLRRAAELREQR